MRLKKELLIYCLLLGLSICLLTAAKFNQSPTSTLNEPVSIPEKCCHKPGITPVSPWHFITQGIFHFSA